MDRSNDGLDRYKEMYEIITLTLQCIRDDVDRPWNADTKTRRLLVLEMHRSHLERVAIAVTTTNCYHEHYNRNHLSLMITTTICHSGSNRT